MTVARYATATFPPGQVCEEKSPFGNNEILRSAQNDSGLSSHPYSDNLVISRYGATGNLTEIRDFSLRYPEISPAGFDAFAGQTA